MKRVAAVALVLMFAVGCAGRNGGGGRGSVIQRTADDSAQRDDHSTDFSQRPLGQR
jgi:hypothetical protein